MKSNYITAFVCILFTIGCLAYCAIDSHILRRDNERQRDKIIRLRMDSTAIYATARRYARWHYQLDNEDKARIDSLIMKEKFKRVKQHVAKSK